MEGGREFFAELSQTYFGVKNEIGGPDELYREGSNDVLAEILAALENTYGPVDVPGRPDRN